MHQHLARFSLPKPLSGDWRWLTYQLAATSPCPCHRPAQDAKIRDALDNDLLESVLQILDRVILAACLTLGLAACAATSADDPANARAPMSADLSCALPSNCVSSLADDPAPLRFDGTAERGVELLRLTLESFPEAKIVRSEGLALEVIFTTRIGFQDQVDFRVQPNGGRIDYRSRSLFGLYDWGKNRSRMAEVNERFAQKVAAERVRPAPPAVAR